MRMKLEGRIIRVKSLKAPVVEIDTATESAYVRFSSNRVARTVFRSEHQGPVVTIDFDEKENVVGIELIGVTEFGIQSLLHQAPVSVAPQLLDKVRYVAARPAKKFAVA